MAGHAKGKVDCGARLFTKRCQDQDCRREATLERHTHCPGCGAGPVLYWCTWSAQPGERCPQHQGQQHHADGPQSVAEAYAALQQSTHVREVFARAYLEAGASTVPAALFAVSVLQARILDAIEAGQPATVQSLARDLSRAAREAADTRRITAEVARDAAASGNGTTLEVGTDLTERLGDPRNTPGGEGVLDVTPAPEDGAPVVAAPVGSAPGRDKP